MYRTTRGNAAGTGGIGLAAFLRRLRRRGRAGLIEAVVWSVGLVAMGLMDPEGAQLVSLCPLDALGLSFCPGCGLGHAVAYLARGDLTASVQAHPLGLPAVLILSVHVARLLRSAAAANSHMYSS